MDKVGGRFILKKTNIPNDIKYNEIISYMENNDKGVSKICFNEIKNLSDFDYIALPILSFDDENNNEYDNDYYRFRGILYLIDKINIKLIWLITTEGTIIVSWVIIWVIIEIYTSTVCFTPETIVSVGMSV